MGKAHFLVSNELLKDLLLLPDDAEITQVVATFPTDQFKVYVEHTDLEDDQECLPWYRTTYEDGEHSVTHFGGWSSSERFKVDG